MPQFPNFDDPAIEDAWCAQQYQMVKAFMNAQNVRHGRIGSDPVFKMAPLLSVWTVESANHPGAVGWWVLSGDLPIDYFSAQNIDHPRKVLTAAADKWDEILEDLKTGKQGKASILGLDKEPELQKMLAARAKSLREIAADERVWA